MLYRTQQIILSAVFLFFTSFFASAEDVNTSMYGDTIFHEDYGQGVGLWGSFADAGLSSLGTMSSLYLGYTHKTAMGLESGYYKDLAYGNAHKNSTITNSTDVLRCANIVHSWIVPGLKDHTGNVNGRYFLADGQTTPGVVFQREVTELCKNSSFEFSVWAANINNENGKPGSPFQFEIWTKDPSLGLNSKLKEYNDWNSADYLANHMPVGTQFESSDGGMAKLLMKINDTTDVVTKTEPGTCMANGDAYVYEITKDGVTPHVVYSLNGSYYCSDKDGKYWYKVIYPSHVNSSYPATDLYFNCTHYSDNSESDWVDVADSYDMQSEYYTYPNKYIVYTNGKEIPYSGGEKYYAYRVGTKTYAAGAAFWYTKLRFNRPDLVYSSNQDLPSYYQAINNTTLSGQSVYLDTRTGGYVYDSIKYYCPTPYDYKHNVYSATKSFRESTTELLDITHYGSTTFSYPCDLATQKRWQQIKGTFKLADQDHVFLILRNFSSNSAGNDFAIDDIVFRPYASFGVSLNLSPTFASESCKYGLVTLLSTLKTASNDEISAINEDLPNCNFYFQGYNGSDWVTINSNSIKIQSATDKLEVNMPLSQYNLYSKFRIIVRTSSVSNGKCLSIGSEELNKVEIDGSPSVLLSGDDICIDNKVDVNGNEILDANGNTIPDIKGTEKGFFVIKNTSQKNQQSWRVKVMYSDGTIGDLIPSIATCK